MFAFQHVLFNLPSTRLDLLNQIPQDFELLAFKMDRIDIALKNIKESEGIQWNERTFLQERLQVQEEKVYLWVQMGFHRGRWDTSCHGQKKAEG